MEIEIVKVCDDRDINTIAVLAREIWVGYFTDIIGQAQVEYMLEKLQSANAIKSQLANGYIYYLVYVDNKAVGYTAVLTDAESQKLMISKIYVLEKLRGKGVGKAILSFIENQCPPEDIKTIWLTVNKNNRSAIDWYKHCDFTIKEQVKLDIGGGFYMDDYIMQKHF